VDGVLTAVPAGKFESATRVGGIEVPPRHIYGVGATRSVTRYDCAGIRKLERG
jgi:hypothetical protein